MNEKQMCNEDYVQVKALDIKARLKDIEKTDSALARKLYRRMPIGANYCIDLVPKWIVWFAVKVRHRHEYFVEADFLFNAYCDVDLQDSDRLVVSHKFFEDLNARVPRDNSKV